MVHGIDELLWDAVQQSDHRSYEILFVKYFPELRDHALHYCGHYEEAEEIASDVLHQLWLKRNTLELHTGLKGYLLTAARNASFNILRKKIGLAEELTEMTTAKEHSSMGIPESRLLVKDMEETLRVAMEKLPMRQREIFRLNRLQDYSVPEIATMLGITEGTVQVQLHKAVKKMKSLFYTSRYPSRKNLFI